MDDDEMREGRRNGRYYNICYNEISKFLQLFFTFSES